MRDWAIVVLPAPMGGVRIETFTNEGNAKEIAKVWRVVKNALDKMERNDARHFAQRFGPRKRKKTCLGRKRVWKKSA